MGEQDKQDKIDFTPLIFDNAVMTSVNIDEMKANLPLWLQRVIAGETLLVWQGGKPVAEIKPVAPAPTVQRPYALCAGEFTVPADFDEPLPESVLSDFEGR